MKHYPMTKEQREFLNRDLATISENLGNIAILLNACYGDNDPPVRRVEEAGAALQRLLWALERQTQPGQVCVLAGEVTEDDRKAITGRALIDDDRSACISSFTLCAEENE